MSYRDKNYETMKLEFDGSIAIVYFDRPEAMNAANILMSHERLEIYTGLSEDTKVRVVIITGNEKAYCAGGDLASFAKFDSREAMEFAKRGMEYQKVLMNMPKPTIAAVAGVAYGGGMENILLCDLRIAADNARLALPEINVGIFPGGGGTQRIVQNIPICKAKEMIYMGKPIDAAEALELGLVNKVVPLKNLMASAIEWAKILCNKPPVALKAAKHAINCAWDTDIYTGMELEIKAWANLYDTQDKKEGMQAFLEKRKPVFKGF